MVMNEHMTTGELFYCLIEDIEDYTMRNESETLDNVVLQLDKIKEHYDNQILDESDKENLGLIYQLFIFKGYEQFADDLQQIIERL